MRNPITVFIVVAATIGVTAQERKPTAQELFAAQSKPAAEHQRLAALAGTWTFTVRYDAGPAGTGEEQGTLTVTPLMGGRFFREEARTRFLGQPFEWVGIHGYDTRKKQYVSTWIDNLSTQIDSMIGAWNESTNTLTYTGEEDHPAEGKATVEWATSVNGNTLRIVMHEGAGAKRRQVMELRATRK